MEKKSKEEYQIIDISMFNDRELAEAFIFPSGSPSAEDKDQEKEFWVERRKLFENRSPQQKMMSHVLQLKFQLEDYVGSNQYKEELNFGYFLNEYVARQEKQDKQFAAEVDIKPSVLSQYINNHRKPTEKFVIRLELHSNGMIPALTWFKLLQKDKEHDILTNEDLRRQEGKHIKGHLAMAY